MTDDRDPRPISDRDIELRIAVASSVAAEGQLGSERAQLTLVLESVLGEVRALELTEGRVRRDCAQLEGEIEEKRKRLSAVRDQIEELRSEAREIRRGMTIGQRQLDRLLHDADKVKAVIDKLRQTTDAARQATAHIRETLHRIDGKLYLREQPKRDERS